MNVQIMDRSTISKIKYDHSFKFPHPTLVRCAVNSECHPCECTFSDSGEHREFLHLQLSNVKVKHTKSSSNFYMNDSKKVHKWIHSDVSRVAVLQRDLKKSGTEQ